jgi:excinuclease ABC subunit A
MSFRSFLSSFRLFFRGRAKRQFCRGFPGGILTAGCDAADVDKLLKVLDKLVDAGNTVLVIEHNLEVIKMADHIIDLGPEGGDGGGSVVFTGTPEGLAECEASYTGQFLKRFLETHRLR